MTDRELLELAAKAAGMRVEFIGDNPHDCTHLKAGTPAFKGEYWNPLTDDGDALRLAIKLRMNFRMEVPHAVSVGWRENQAGAPTRDSLGPWFWKEWLHDHNDDAVAATRRAIVRAAAAVGESA